MKKSLIILTIILSFCLLLVGCGASVTQGEKGDKGDKGEQGEQGESGRGVEKFEIIDGELIIYYIHQRTVFFANSSLEHLTVI